MGKTCSMRYTKNSDRKLLAETPQAGGEFINGLTHTEVKYSNGRSINTEIRGPTDGVRFLDQRRNCQPLRTTVHTVHGEIRYLNVNAYNKYIRLGQCFRTLFPCKTPTTNFHTPTNSYTPN